MKLDPKALSAAKVLYRDRSMPTFRNLEAAIQAYLTAIGETHVLVPKAALDWLNGAGPDADGHWFGDAPDDAPAARAFWWRSKFRAMLAAAKEGE